MNGTLPRPRFPAINLGGIAGRIFAATIVTVAAGMIIENAEWPDWLRSIVGGGEPAGEMRTDTPLPEPERAGEVVNFTLFRTVPYRDFTVTTGLRYQTMQGPPAYQYCYAEREQTGGDVSAKLTLAFMNRDGRATYVAIDEEDARPFAMAGAELRNAAQTHCLFLETGRDDPALPHRPRRRAARRRPRRPRRGTSRCTPPFRLKDSDNVQRDQ